GLNTLGAVAGTALAGFFLIEYVGIRASLWGTALVNLLIGVVALRLPDPRPDARGESADPGREPGEAPGQGVRRVALLLLALVGFGLLPRYVIAVFQAQSLGATGRLLAMGLGVGAVVLIPALGMGMTFPILTDLAAPRDAARAADVGRAYAFNTFGSIAGAVLT